MSKKVNSLSIKGSISTVSSANSAAFFNHATYFWSPPPFSPSSFDEGISFSQDFRLTLQNATDSTTA